MRTIVEIVFAEEIYADAPEIEASALLMKQVNHLPDIGVAIAELVARKKIGGAA